ncbi:transcriptional regulator, partial [mine drainage metagenome]
SSTAIAAFRTRWATKARDERKTHWTDEQTLVNAELLVDGHVTYAALILFWDSRRAGAVAGAGGVGVRVPILRGVWPCRRPRRVSEGFFLWHDAIWNKINLRNDRQSYQDGLFRIELPTFDEVSVREALLNAVAHRDYRLGGSVFVRQYGQRLE